MTPRTSASNPSQQLGSDDQEPAVDQAGARKDVGSLTAASADASVRIDPRHAGWLILVV